MSSEHNPVKPAELEPGGSQQTPNSNPLPSVQGSAAIFRPESSGIPAPTVAPVHQMQGQLPLMVESSSLQHQALYAPAPGVFANPPQTLAQLPASAHIHPDGSNAAHFTPAPMAQASTSVFHQVPPPPHTQYGVAGTAWNGSDPQQLALVSNSHSQPPLVHPHTTPLQDHYPPVLQPTSNGYPVQQNHPMTMPHGFEHAQLQQGMHHMQHTHPHPQWMGHSSQIPLQQLPTSQPVPVPTQGGIDNVPSQVSVPELDIVGQQVQTGMAQNAETKDEIEKTKRQLDELKQILRQRQSEEEKKHIAAERQREEKRQMEIEEEKRRQLERDRQRQLADEAQRNIMEERLELLERENTAFKEQQAQLALQTQNLMMLAKTEQMQSLQAVQPQEMVLPPPHRHPSPTQEAIPSVANSVPQSSTTVTSVSVGEKTDTAVAIAQPETVDSSRGAPLSQTSQNATGSEGVAPEQQDVPTSTVNKADQELVKKMEELEARLKLLHMREKSFQSEKEKQDHMLREREAAMKEEQAQWMKQKEEEERKLQEGKAKLAEDQAAFLRLQAEVKKQQEEYRLKQEELFGMMQLMNKQQPAGAPRGMQLSGGNLPPGWEKRLDQRTGRFYYIDHTSRTTHWNPPTNWLLYGQDSQPPSRTHPQPQVAQPIVGGVSGPTPSAGVPIPPGGGHTVTQPPSQPKVDRSMKPVTPQQPLTQPEVNRMLKPMSPALLQQKTRALQGISGSWVSCTSLCSMRSVL